MSVDWGSIGIGCAMTAVVHPFTYVKVLVQLGHEPLTPSLRRNMFFRKQLLYPSVIEYIKHIRRTDGYIGLYRGLMPRICANTTTSLTYALVSNAISPKKNDKNQLDELQELTSDNKDFSACLKKVCEQTTKDLSARCAAVIISQPFHVIAIRTMAEFIGHDTVYTNMYTSVVAIYTDDGILGFFAGLAPRLMSEIIGMWLCNLLAFAVNRFILTDNSELKDLRQHTQVVTSYIAQTVTYPLSVTSTVMATNGANILAGQPPFVPHYDSWFSCLRDLHKKGMTSRGSSMLFRKAAAHLYAAGSVTPMPVPTPRINN